MKLTKIIFALSLLLITFSCAEEDLNSDLGIVNPEAESFPSYDASGDIEIRVWYNESSGLEHAPSVTVDVDPEFVLVGGGAWVKNASYGAYITESSPSTNKRTWTARSKDHLTSDTHSIVAYAVGMRVNGLTRSQLASHVILKEETTPTAASHPSETVSVSNAYHLVGGGVKVHWSGSGNMVTSSYPSGNTWKVSSKDHIKGSQAKITAYAIGLKKSIPGFGNIVRHLPSPQSSYVSTGVDTERSNVPYGYVTTCAGARTTFSGSGRMLMGYRPDFRNADYTESKSKDHASASSGRLYNYIIAVKKQQSN
ncbi:hypothetical protein [Ekhidna sp. To15]|uniref:hypothetical protein n=1 Tax=Ekhidna sp. To15 TaxID=3395267 RepID=UPI003F5218D6